MNTKFLVFLSLTLFYIGNIKAQTNNTNAKNNQMAEQWKWPDSLEAIKAAPQSHIIVFEDENVRILQVIVLPEAEDPLHAHKYPGVFWGVKGSGSFIYFSYDYNAKHQLVKKDSSTTTVNPKHLNIGRLMPPEPPHAVKNMGKDTLIGYRVEYKKPFMK